MPARPEGIPESIRARTSTRSLQDTRLDPYLEERVRCLLNKPCQGPFGAQPRFRLLSSFGGKGDPGRLGLLGFVRHAPLYLAGAVLRGKWSLVDYGYCMERVILEITSLGLSTCWLALFNRSLVEEEMDLSPDEVVPAISPVGYAASSRTLTESLMKLGLRSRTRRPWKDLFFHHVSRQPLTPEEAGSYADLLESVRWAPSRANRQPWRIFVHSERKEVHFFARGNSHLDLGIAMKHFQVAARENGVPGGWGQVKNIDLPGGLNYIATWLLQP